VNATAVALGLKANWKQFALLAVGIIARSQAAASTGKPAVLHSGMPSSRRRAASPFERNVATASKDITHHGPRQ